MHPLRFGLKLSQAASLDTLTAIWRVADDSGFDHCWNMDHFASLGPDDGSPEFILIVSADPVAQAERVAAALPRLRALTPS
jgi:alkanesulfonate monooxygenase SsuD/methylene tetrahydromethanopterin reductase-like flavin-dependent oxidoreductase (luciferase family)